MGLTNFENAKSLHSSKPIQLELGYSYNFRAREKTQVSTEEAANIKDTTEKKMSFFRMSSGYYSFGDFTMGSSLGYFWDKETFWTDVFAMFAYDAAARAHESQNLIELGLRFYYPFSGEGKTFYIGSGGGFVWKWTGDSDNFDLLTEAIAGYTLFRWNNLLYRLEVHADAFVYETVIKNKQATSWGLRAVMGL
jgi:hypothetical protein